jgi:hypothetical protein
MDEIEIEFAVPSHFHRPDSMREFCHEVTNHCSNAGFLFEFITLLSRWGINPRILSHSVAETKANSTMNRSGQMSNLLQMNDIEVLS